MSKILSQDEIDALLSAPLTAERAADRTDEPGPAANFIRYNFRRPDRISKEQIHALHFLHERFARNVSQSLAAYLRSMTDLSLVSVEQFAYSEFLMSLSDPTAFYAISMQPFDDLAGLEINPAVAFAMVERMLGGEGKTGAVERALTDIEQNVIDSVVKILLDSLTETWRPVVDLKDLVGRIRLTEGPAEITAPSGAIRPTIDPLHRSPPPSPIRDSRPPTPRSTPRRSARGQASIARPSSESVAHSIGKRVRLAWRALRKNSGDDSSTAPHNQLVRPAFSVASLSRRASA